MTCKPRRCSSRWLDGDCPKGVLAIMDHPNTIDRYTVIYSEVHDSHRGPYLTYVAMNTAPFHPQGFGQHGEMSTHEAASYRYANKHRYARWSDLPPDCKRLVLQDLAS
jgi:hypothetical protein